MQRGVLNIVDSEDNTVLLENKDLKTVYNSTFKQKNRNDKATQK